MNLLIEKTNEHKAQELNLSIDNHTIVEEKAKERDVKNAAFINRIDTTKKQSIEELQAKIKEIQQTVKEKENDASTRLCAAITLKNTRCKRFALTDSDFCQRHVNCIVRKAQQHYKTKPKRLQKIDNTSETQSRNGKITKMDENDVAQSSEDTAKNKVGKHMKVIYNGLNNGTRDLYSKLIANKVNSIDHAKPNEVNPSGDDSTLVKLPSKSKTKKGLKPDSLQNLRKFCRDLNVSQSGSKKQLQKRIVDIQLNNKQNLCAGSSTSRTHKENIKNACSENKACSVSEADVSNADESDIHMESSEVDISQSKDIAEKESAERTERETDTSALPNSGKQQNTEEDESTRESNTCSTTQEDMIKTKKQSKLKELRKMCTDLGVSHVGTKEQLSKRIIEAQEHSKKVVCAD